MAVADALHSTCPGTVTLNASIRSIHCTSWPTTRSCSRPAHLPLSWFESPRRRPSPEAPALSMCYRAHTECTSIAHLCSPTSELPFRTVTECALTTRRTCGEQPYPANRVICSQPLSPVSFAFGSFGQVHQCGILHPRLHTNSPAYYQRSHLPTNCYRMHLARLPDCPPEQVLFDQTTSSSMRVPC